MQVVWLLLLALPIACVAWTITHEDILSEARAYCEKQSQSSDVLLRRKLFFIFTCEYCFSHYVTIFFLFITRYKLLFDDWRGYLIGGFALVWVANQYMSLYGRLRLEIRKERVEIKEVEQQVEARESPGLKEDIEITKSAPQRRAS
ncbi:MAG TPA: hypothetical protein VG759_11565 [Candidatus Angelobacter sp.]|jgi:hypothetical protein|nr:hypothetical protein [Candidatus Angelobacter sp.]